MQRVTALLTATTVIMTGATLGTDAQSRRDRFRMHGETDTEQTPSVDARGAQLPAPRTTEAPTGFDNETNGFLRQGPPFETIDEDNVVPLRSFNDNRFIFEEVEVVAEGLGPIYNAQSCGSVIKTSRRAVPAKLRSTARVGSWATSSSSRSAVRSSIRARPTRTSWSPSSTKTPLERSVSRRTPSVPATWKRSPTRRSCAIREEQPAALRGAVALAPVLEAEGQPRIGRFGWKYQHPSLLSFAADAYLNEMGITSPLFPTRTPRAAACTSRLSTPCAIRRTTASTSRRSRTSCVQRKHRHAARSTRERSGRRNDLSEHLGCAACHVSTLVTSPPGTRINGGEFTVPEALGNKTIHPYSDFLLHDIGTGDGIPVQPTPEFAWTAPQIRTAPLWALRTRNRLCTTVSRSPNPRSHRAPRGPSRTGYRALSGIERSGPGATATVLELPLRGTRARALASS